MIHGYCSDTATDFCLVGCYGMSAGKQFTLRYKQSKKSHSFSLDCFVHYSPFQVGTNQHSTPFQKTCTFKNESDLSPLEKKPPASVQGWLDGFQSQTKWCDKETILCYPCLESNQIFPFILSVARSLH